MEEDVPVVRTGAFEAEGLYFSDISGFHGVLWFQAANAAAACADSALGRGLRHRHRLRLRRRRLLR